MMGRPVWQEVLPGDKTLGEDWVEHLHPDDGRLMWQEVFLVIKCWVKIGWNIYTQMMGRLVQQEVLPGDKPLGKD